MRRAAVPASAALALALAAAAQDPRPTQVGVEGGSVPESLVIEVTEHSPWQRAGGRIGLGRPLAPGEIDPWDIDVRFDGAGLPPGSGDTDAGEEVYEEKCASCHGSFGEGEGRWPALTGGEDTLTHQGDQRPEKTVGSYWPYAPTLFDYVRRAMPYNAPQSLTDDETYAVVAYVLLLGDIVGEGYVADAGSLPAVEMPNAGGFFDDPRPDVLNVACMSACVDAEGIRLIEAIRGVTPLGHLTGEGDGAGAAAAMAAAGAPADVSGRNALYDRSCAVCHANGVGGAPLLGADEWAARLSAAGFGGLVSAVLSGKNAMPPRGGAPADAGDDEIAAAVRFMLEVSGLAVP